VVYQAKNSTSLIYEAILKSYDIELKEIGIEVLKS
jgi:hypothetical protein